MLEAYQGLKNNLEREGAGWILPEIGRVTLDVTMISLSTKNELKTKLNEFATGWSMMQGENSSIVFSSLLDDTRVPLCGEMVSDDQRRGMFFMSQGSDAWDMWLYEEGAGMEVFYSDHSFLGKQGGTVMYRAYWRTLDTGETQAFCSRFLNRAE